MSGSRQKSIRQNNKNALSRKEQERLRQQKQRQKTTLAVVAVVACVVLLIAAMIFVNSKLIRRIMPAYLVDGQVINIDVFEYYYNSVYNQLYTDASETYGEYAKYIMPGDVSYVHGVDYDDTRTWHDYLMDETADTISGVIYYNALAAAEGYTMTENDIAQLEAAKAAIEAYAQYSGVAVDEYLAQSFGKAMTYEVYVQELERVILADSYRRHVRDSFTYTGEEIDAYYAQNKDQLDYYTLRITYLAASNQPGYTAENPAAAMEVLRDGWAEIEKAIANGVNYYEAVKPYVTEVEAESFGTDDSAKTTMQGAGINSDYSQWVMDAARKEGDVTCAETDGGMYIVQFVERDENDYNTRDFYILSYPVSINPGDYNSEEEYQTVLDMYTQFGSQTLNDYYLRWQEGEGTVEAFGKIAEEYSATNNTSSKLEKTLKNQYGDVSEWLYDSARQPGDVTSMYCEELGAYCMVCYIGENVTAAEYIAETELRSEDYSAWLDHQEAARMAVFTSEEKYWSRLIGR